jgi:hypothetical protein
MSISCVRIEVLKTVVKNRHIFWDTTLFIPFKFHRLSPSFSGPKNKPSEKQSVKKVASRTKEYEGDIFLRYVG